MNSGPGCRSLALEAGTAGQAGTLAGFSELSKRLTGKVQSGTGNTVARAGDEVQLARVRAGDREAYRYFVEKYQERAFSIAYSMVRDAHDAEDVVQESFVKAYLSLPEFRSESGFYTWFYRIVYNMAVDFKRKAGRRDAFSARTDAAGAEAGESGAGVALAAPGRLAGPQDMALRREQGQAIQKVLSGLSDEHRAVVVLREIDGLSYDEIARVIGVSKGTVMSRLFYARRRMQESLAEFAPSGWKGGNGAGDASFHESQSEEETIS